MLIFQNLILNLNRNNTENNMHKSVIIDEIDLIQHESSAKGQRYIM